MVPERYLPPRLHRAQRATRSSLCRSLRYRAVRQTATRLQETPAAPEKRMPLVNPQGPKLVYPHMPSWQTQKLNKLPRAKVHRELCRALTNCICPFTLWGFLHRPSNQCTKQSWSYLVQTSNHPHGLEFLRHTGAILVSKEGLARCTFRDGWFSVSLSMSQ